MQKIPAYSDEYRSQAKKIVFYLLVFIFIYLLILIISILFASGLIISTLIVVTEIGPRPVLKLLSFIPIGIGIVLLIFIFRFFFRKYTVDRSLWVEINKNQQPKLFELIESIAMEIDTSLPKRVYISPGVDAMVFYDSNFWNLFFPSKENLVIGLGLINSTNESELKAILVHEFGHFTQRCRKVFSYVYIENQIIYKMLIDEEYYFSLLSKFNKGIIIWIVIGYANLIKWILRKAYEIVYLNYMSLSRELEYHADEISANVTGTVPNVTSLLRAELAHSTFDYLGEFYYGLVSENLKTDNIYPQHYFALISSAKEYDAEIKDNLPLITGTIINRFNRSKLVIKDQWASHPSIPDRIARLEKLDIQSQVSTKLENLSLEKFQQKYTAELEKFRFDKKYNYYYNTRNISVFDFDAVTKESFESVFSDIKEVYTSDNLELILVYSGMENDIKLLESIDRKEIRIDSFEYDGEKYHAKGSKKVLEKLLEQHKKMFEKLNSLDMNIFKFFLHKAQIKGEENILKEKYKVYFNVVKEDKENLELYLDMINSIQFIAQFQSFSSIEENMAEFKEKEKIFRKKFGSFINDEHYKHIIDAEKIGKIEKYLSKEWKYFEEPNYNEEALSVLEESIYLFYSICSRAPSAALKKLLDYQISLVSK
jgi:Zn-dependent protease with chaperone function